MSGLTAENIRGALAPFKDIQKAAPVEIDLHVVATSIAEDVAKATDAEDPVAGLDKLVKRVDAVHSFLEKASVPEESDGVFAPSSDPLTAEFAKAAADDEETPAEDDAEEEDSKPSWMKGGKKKGAKKSEAPTQKSATEDGYDDVAYVNQDDGKGDKWDLDLSPQKPPVDRASRLTKREVPVQARPGSLAHADAKYARARDRAMGRDDGRATRPAPGGG